MDIASLVIGTIAGGILSWWIAAIFYRRSTEDLRARLKQLSSDVERKDSAEYFEFMLTHGTWSHHSIAGRDTWICDERSVFKIVRNGDYEDFDEEWTRKPPDQRAQKSSIDLKINDSTVRSLDFISLDGGRYLVPMTTKRVLDGQPLYFWERDSLQFKVGRIVGHYYRFDNIEQTAQFLGVEIVSAQHH
jgi:hypothetical protein